MNRKITSILVLIALCFSITGFGVIVSPSAAQAAAIDNISGEISAVYPYLTETEKIAIQNARSNIQTLNDEQWTSIIDPLLKPEVKAAFKTGAMTVEQATAAAKTALINFAAGVGDIYYSTTPGVLATTLTEFRNNYQASFQTLFGTDVTIDDLYQFLTATKAELPTVISTNATYISNLTTGNNAALITTMPDVLIDAMGEALAQSAFTNFSGKLSDIGWSPQILVEQQQLLGEAVDTNDAAQLALAMAAVRSQTALYNNSAPTVQIGLNADTEVALSGGNVTYTLKIMGRDAANLVDWNSSNTNVASLSDNGLGNILTPKTAGTTTITAYRAPQDNSGTPANDWVMKFNVTVISSNLGGGGGGGGGSNTPTTPPVTPPVTPPAPPTTAVIGGSAIVDRTVTTNTQGTVIETIKVKTAAVTAEIEKAKTEGKTEVQIQIATAPTSTAVVTIPNEVVQSAKGMGLQIATTNATIELPKALVETLAIAGKGIDLTVTPSNATAAQAAMTGVTAAQGASVVGTPIDVTTGIKGSTTVTLSLAGVTIPTNPTARANFLNSLAVFAVHSDGTKEVVPGTVVYDAAHNPIGVSFNTTKFSTFAIIKVAPQASLILTDIAGHWAEASIKKLVASEAIAGYPDKSFKPNNTITRAEFAVTLVKALKLEAKTGKVFNDTASHWAKDYIATANAYGIINGYSDTTFGPDDVITREQMAVMIVKAANLTAGTDSKTFADDSKVAAWAKDAVNIITTTGIMSGYPDGSFKPQGSATRAEAVTVIAKIVK